MMKGLLENARAAKRLTVLRFVARLILAFAFLAGTIHAPAMAHAEPSDHQVAHGGFVFLDMLADHHEEPAPSSDGKSDNLHHHHCPAAVPARDAGVADARVGRDQVLTIHRAAALTSFSQAPPTEPPSA